MKEKTLKQKQIEYREYHRLYRAKNREKIRNYNKEYNKQWRKKNGYHNENKSKKLYPEKQRARSAVYRAIKKGKIIKLPCQYCGNKNSQAHHDNYLKPLKIKWFCPLHHRQYEQNKAINNI